MVSRDGKHYAGTFTLDAYDTSNTLIAHLVGVITATRITVHTPAVDPVVQALSLTDVVVEAAVTALLCSFAVQAHKRFGTLDPQELVSLKG